MTEPARLLDEGRTTIELSRGIQYVVHETDAERAKEISAEFYPNSGAAADALSEPSSDRSEKDEQLARICELARRLGYNDERTKMLVGQLTGSLAAVERNLLNELDERPEAASNKKSKNEQNLRPGAKPAEAVRTSSPNQPVSSPSKEPKVADEGFLF